jgi:hypothetical protein
MIFQKPTENIHLKFKLKKQHINIANKNLFDFYYDKINDLYSIDNDYKETEEFPIYETNNAELKNMLGIDMTLQSLKTLIMAIKNQEGKHNTELLEQKYKRLSKFYDHYIDVIFNLCHLLYYRSWDNAENGEVTNIDKSGKDFQTCLKTALELTSDMRSKYEKIFEQEYNALPMINKYITQLKKSA